MSKPSLPSVNPKKFIGRPEFERLYRLAEVLFETSRVPLDDLTAALSFEDVYDTEDYLGRFLNAEMFNIDFETSTANFQPQAYIFALDKLKDLI